MNKFKNLIVICLMAVISVFIFTGCGSGFKGNITTTNAKIALIEHSVTNRTTDIRYNFKLSITNISGETKTPNIIFNPLAVSATIDSESVTLTNPTLSGTAWEADAILIGEYYFIAPDYFAYGGKKLTILYDGEAFADYKLEKDKNWLKEFDGVTMRIVQTEFSSSSGLIRIEFNNKDVISKVVKYSDFSIKNLTKNSSSITLYDTVTSISISSGETISREYTVSLDYTDKANHTYALLYKGIQVTQFRFK